jgi:hypothetical protein
MTTIFYTTKYRRGCPSNSSGQQTGAGITPAHEAAKSAGWCGMMAALEDAARDGDMAAALASDGLPSDSGCGEIDGEEIIGREAAVEAYREGEREALAEARENAEVES